MKVPLGQTAMLQILPMRVRALPLPLVVRHAAVPIRRHTKRCFLPARPTICRPFSGTAATAGAAACNETRCSHCFITFATPAELVHHATQHCFPDDPDAVLRRYPPGAEALDTVSQETVVVLGAADNKSRAHAFVSTQSVRRGLVADLPISRLQLVSRRRNHCARAAGAVRFCSSQLSYRTAPLTLIPRAAVGELARATADGPAARYLD